MSVADTVFKVIFTVVYSVLTLAGVYFIVVYIKKGRSRKKQEMSLINSDGESYGTDDVLTAPSYVKKSIIMLFSFTFIRLP